MVSYSDGMPSKNPGMLKLSRFVSVTFQDGFRGFAVPDIQRDFQWNYLQVRSLAASVIAGNPIGSILLAESITVPDGARVVARRLDGGSKLAPGARYVLDGQQRLLSLFAVFRPILQKKHDGTDSEEARIYAWVERQEALQGLWYLDFRKYVRAVVAKCSRGPSPEHVREVTSNAQLIEDCLAREASLGLSRENSKWLLNGPASNDNWPANNRAKRPTGTNIPLWLLLRATQREADGLGKWRDELKKKFRRQHAGHEEGVDAAFEQIFEPQRVADFQIPLAVVPPVSAARAALIFRRLNSQGSALDGTDLVLSQLSMHDLTLRRKIRKFREDLRHAARGTLLGPMRGLREADVLETCFSIRQVVTGMDQSAPWPRRMETRLAIAASAQGAKELHEAFSRLAHHDQEPLKAAAEILRACGVLDRSHWPVTNVCIAILVCTSLHSVPRSSMEWGNLKTKLVRWWWAQGLQCAGSRESPSVQKLVLDLGGRLRDDRWDDVIVASRFSECEPPIDLKAPRRGPALGGGVLARLVECLLLRRLRHDFVRGDVPDLNEVELDLHHIFPIKWASDQGLGNVDVLANLALVAKVTNRDHIRAKGPKQFADELCKGGRSRDAFESILLEHGINPMFYLSEDYHAFLKDRVEWFDKALVNIANGKG